MRRILLIIFLMSPLFSFFISLFIGTYYIPFTDIITMITLKTFQLLSNIINSISFGRMEVNVEIPYPRVSQVVLFNIRLPRVLLAMIVGSALAISRSRFTSYI